MSESMSSPWIRAYFMDVAETHGAQLYNAPVSTLKKRAQLTEFLTYQEDSYVWAWISDKDYRVPARISKDAAANYKSKHNRSIIDSRFNLVFISGYRPMFSPRPLGLSGPGNSPVSHISLEIERVSLIGTGAHLFGTPRDLESDENMQEWVLGLRQDGGNGNVLKLRKEKNAVQNKRGPPSPPPPPPFPHRVSDPHGQTIKVDTAAKPMSGRPHDLKHAYAKRWRVIEIDRWKFIPAEERPNAQTRISHLPDIPPLNTASRPGPGQCTASVSPIPLHCAPSPIPSQRQGTPTNWSPSIRGSSLPPAETSTANGIQQLDKPDVDPTSPQLPSDTERYTAEDVVTTSDTHSLQPPTPAQRTKRSPLPCSSLLSPSSPELFACSPPHPSQSLSSLPPSSPSLPLPSSSMPMSLGIRKNLQRKIPRPGTPVPRPDPTQQGPIQILVPNSDTSGTGSSQPYSQSHLSQPQQQPQLLSHSLALPSSLAKDFKPPDTSTPRESKPPSTPRRTSKMFAEFSPPCGDVNEQETTSACDRYTGVDTREGLEPNLPVLSAPRIEVLKERNSDSESEIDELQTTHSTVRAEVDPDKQTELRSNSGILRGYSPDKQENNGRSSHVSTGSSERPGSRSSMHSLFSDSSAEETAASSPAPHLTTSRIEETVQRATTPTDVPRHDSEAWKEPSFLAKSKGKGKAPVTKKPGTPIAKRSEKRRRSTPPEPPASKRAKAASPSPKAPRATSGRTITRVCTRPQALETSATEKRHSKDRSSTMGTTDAKTLPFASESSGPRLANFVVDFEKIDRGKKSPMPRLYLDPDVKRALLTTGRVRKNRKVEEDGSVYINL